jgi:hypothetical protein
VRTLNFSHVFARAVFIMKFCGSAARRLFSTVLTQKAIQEFDRNLVFDPASAKAKAKQLLSPCEQCPHHFPRRSASQQNARQRVFPLHEFAKLNHWKTRPAPVRHPELPTAFITSYRSSIDSLEVHAKKIDDRLSTSTA